MVLSAFLATRREFSASRFSSLAVNSSISLRSVSSRFRSRPVKSFAIEVKCVQFSFQPPPVPALRVQRRDVVLALARHLEARLPQRGDDLVAIPHRSVLDTLQQVVPDQIAGGGFELEPGPQPRRLDVGAVAGLLHPGPSRIVRTAPAVLVVEGVAQRIERLTPARRGDVEAPAGLQIASRGQDMHVRAAVLLPVEHRRPCVAVTLQPGPSRLLEGVKDRFDLLVGGLVVGGPGDHAGGVPVLEVERVGDRGDHVRVPPQHLDALARIPGGVPLSEEVVGRGPRRARPAGQELNVHRVRALEASQRGKRPLDGDKAGRDLDGLGRLLVRIGPAGDLVEVVPDARDLLGALALDRGSAGRPCPRAGHGPAYQRRERHAGGRGLGPPLGGLLRREADGDDDRAAPSHQAMPTRGNGGTAPPTGCAGARVCWGSKGRSPSPAPRLYRG